MLRALRLTLLVWPLAGCLAPFDASPEGYGCVDDTTCAAGYFCIQAVCRETPPVNPVQAVLRLHEPNGAERFEFDSVDLQNRIASGEVESLGPAFVVSREQTDDRVPVYRSYSAGRQDFLYTVSSGEVTSAERLGYVSQGIVFHVYPPSSAQGTEVFRVQRGGLHRYPFGAEERAAQIAAGWNAEQPSFRADPIPVESGAVRPVPPSR